METVSAQHLRDGWRRYREAAHFEHKTFLVTYFNTPVAAVLPPDVWRRGLERVPHGDRCREIGVRESRVELRKLLDRARSGGHTIITKHGDEDTVIVPYRWLMEALPELVNTSPTRTGNRLPSLLPDAAVAASHSARSPRTSPPPVATWHPPGTDQPSSEDPPA